jgi:hypothetical protein
MRRPQTYTEHPLASRSAIQTGSSIVVTHLKSNFSNRGSVAIAGGNSVRDCPEIHLTQFLQLPDGAGSEVKWLFLA